VLSHARSRFASFNKTYGTLGAAIAAANGKNRTRQRGPEPLLNIRSPEVQSLHGEDCEPSQWTNITEICSPNVPHLITNVDPTTAYAPDVAHVARGQVVHDPTTTPNSVTSAVHDRMPVVLDRSDYDLWLDPGMKDAVIVSELLKPFDTSAMCCYPANLQMISARGCLLESGPFFRHVNHCSGYPRHCRLCLQQKPDSSIRGGSAPLSYVLFRPGRFMSVEDHICQLCASRA
jgi:hypothetical protein